MTTKTITLTSEEQKLITQLVNDYIINNPVRQSPARRQLGQAVDTAINGTDYTVDHQSSADFINRKLQEAK